MVWDNLAELREYKAEVKLALKAAVTGRAYTFTAGGSSRTITRNSISELRAELAQLEQDERALLGKNNVRIAYITTGRE